MSGTESTLSPVASGRRTPWLWVSLLALVAVGVFAAAVSLQSDRGSVALPETSPIVEAQDDDGAAAGDEDVAEPPVSLVVTQEVFLSRDPFEPVVPEDPAQDATTPGTTGGTPTPGLLDPTQPTTPTTPIPVNPSVPAPGTPVPLDPRCVGQEELICNGAVVTLLELTDVDGQQGAVIQVDTVIYEVVIGQRFASNFELRAIDPPNVTILFGDSAFILRAGVTVLK